MARASSRATWLERRTSPRPAKKLLRKEHERRVMKNLDRLDRRDACPA